MQQEKAMPLSGIVNLYKPKGISSQKAVATVKRLTSVAKCGHTGTLDPNAQGVLPIMLGNATRFADLLLSNNKEYIATLQLGRTTATLDEEGANITFIPRDQMTVTKEAFENALLQFAGETEQIPPMYSALSVGGKKLYKFARQGIEVERVPRKILISEITCQSFDPAQSVASILVRCTKGTYIRTLVSDIGEALGCGAVMTDLVRTVAGAFTVGTCVTIDDLAEYSIDNLLIPVEACFPELVRAEIEPFYLTLMQNGQRILLTKLNLSLPEGALLRLYDTMGRFAGIGRAVVYEENPCLELYKKMW